MLRLKQYSKLSVINLHAIKCFSTNTPSSSPPVTKKKVTKPSGSESKMSHERKSALDEEKKIAEGLQGFYEAAEKAKHFKPNFTPEQIAEHQQIGHEYSRQIRIRDNLEKKDYATKIWLQQEAMRALPSSLRAHAEIIDETPPPKGRPLPVWVTPPIKGFNAHDYTSSQGQDEDDVSVDDLPGGR
jgi:hypothetical protein